MPSRTFPDSEEPEIGPSVVCDAEPRAGSHRQGTGRLQDRRDPTAMTVPELLTAILSHATEPACRELASTYGNVRRLARVHEADLRDHGLKPRAIDKLAVVFEIARRHGEDELVPGQPFRGSHDIYAHFRERLAAERQEQFITVLLDNKNRMIRDVVVALAR